MDRKVLASRLLDIAGDLAALADKKVAAKASQDDVILAMARTKIAYQLGTEVAKTVTEVSNLAQAFKAQHAELIVQLAELEKATDEKREMLKAYYRTWKTESGYEKIRRALLEQAQQCMTVGEIFTDLADGLTVAKRESEQESYKEKYNILVSTLNEAELAKYHRILDSFFSKQITELKTGVKELDGTVKEWHESAQAIAEERGIDLPKASMKGARTAGVVVNFLDVLKQIIPDFKRRIQAWAADLWNNISGNTRQLTGITERLLAMASKAKAVMGN